MFPMVLLICATLPIILYSFVPELYETAAPSVPYVEIVLVLMAELGVMVKVNGNVFAAMPKFL